MYNPITENDIKQKEYLDLLSHIKLSLFSDYNIKQIMFNETFFCLKCSYYNVLKLFFKCLFFKNFIFDCKIESKDILLLYSKNYRIDHDEYWEKIKKDINNFDNITILINPKKELNLKKIFKRIRYFNILFNELHYIKKKKDRLFFSCKLLEKKMVLDYIQSLKLHPKIVMCFSDNSDNENVLMQYFKFQNAITITNQHGFCIFKSNEYDRLNQSQILNFKCDYFLARGIKQKEQFILAGFNPNRIKVVGFIGSSNESIIISNNKCIGIYLDCPTIPLADENNIKLINIGKKISKVLNIKFLIKCHPQDKIDKYRDLVDDNCVDIYGKEIGLNETFQKVDICITHASATYIDSYVFGLRCFKMKSNVEYPIAVQDDEFSSAEEIINLIIEWNQKSDDEKRAYINDVRKQYTSDWCDGNINTILQELLNKKSKI